MITFICREYDDGLVFYSGSIKPSSPFSFTDVTFGGFARVMIVSHVT